MLTNQLNTVSQFNISQPEVLPTTPIVCKHCGEDCNDRKQGDEHYTAWRKEGFCATCHPKFFEDVEPHRYSGIHEF